jgi:carbon storage regulator
MKAPLDHSVDQAELFSFSRRRTTWIGSRWTMVVTYYFVGSAPGWSSTLQGGLMMLVLTRQIGEEIVIDGNIRIMVTAVKGGKIRLGIVAPPSVMVDRKEVHERRAQFEYECDWAQPGPVS